MFKYLFSLSIAISPFLFASENSPHQQDLTGIPYTWHWPASYSELSSWSKIAAYKIASHLTDPVCKAREYSVRFQMLSDLPSSSTSIKTPIESIYSYVNYMQLIDERWVNPDQVSRFVENCFLIGGSAVFSALAPITALPAMVLRFAASNLETESFIHYTGQLQEKEAETNLLTHMQWNICGVKAGYDIEEGGQMPIRDDLLPFSENRIVKIAEKISNEDPDFLCLNEVFDINDAIYLVQTLQNKYAHFVIQCGSRTEGLNSGLFFATKFGVNEISFTPFPKESLVGTAKHSEKGFLTVKTHDSKGAIATLIVSHLQHSNEPEYPTTEEKIARAQELSFILEKIKSCGDENIILSGDLNLEDEEFMQLSPKFYSQFIKTIDYSSPLNEIDKTWLGDEWYVEYGNRNSTFSLISARDTSQKRRVSQAINLDHVLVKIRADASLTPEITTLLKHTGYDPKKVLRDSLSDHMILFSSIQLRR